MIRLSECRNIINSGKADAKLLDLYVDPALLAYEKDRYLKALDRFCRLYGDNEIFVFSAPGRSEVMGNHTDHQQGQIIAASINLDIIAIVHPNNINEIRITSGDMEEIVVDLNDLEANPDMDNGTKAIVKGIAKGFLNRGYKAGGFNAYSVSDVKIGSGLSSSAAFETVIGTILSEVYNDGSVTAEEIAIIGQFAENVYFGKPCGLMDQMACSVGGLIHVDFANPADPSVSKIDFDLNRSGYSLCITDTKSSHADLTAEYSAIPDEMKKIASFFGRDVLNGTKLDELISNASELREKFGDRALLRAIHFVCENKRVEDGVKVLASGDLDSFLRLIRLSGRSSFEALQNVYVPADSSNQPLSVALVASDAVLDPLTTAVRVHGGGFAGTIQAFVKNEAAYSYKDAMDKIFGEGSCMTLKIRPFGGTLVLG